MSKALSAWGLVLLLLCGCAGPPTPGPSLGETAPPPRLGLEVTLLPAFDSRSFPGPEEFPDLKAAVPVMIPAETVLQAGAEVLRREGVFAVLRPYKGPRPEGPRFDWSDFPLRGLETDLALGLELTRLELKETGQNVLVVPHVLLNAALLPFFAAANVASNGHFDLAGTVVPSNVVKHTFQVQLNVLSLSGGGLIFSKTYEVEATGAAVPDLALKEGFFRSRDDGQDLGRAAAPRIIEAAFTRIARDPELASLPLYVRTARVSRLLAEERVPPRLKTRLLDELAPGFRPPGLTPSELESMASPFLTLADQVELVSELGPAHGGAVTGGAFLEAYAADPAWLEREKAQSRLHALTCRVLLDLAGELGRKKMDRPLEEDEEALEDKVLATLARLGLEFVTNRLYRSFLEDPEAGLAGKQALLGLMGRDLEVLDNEEFVEAQLDLLRRRLDQGSAEEKKEAAALLVGLEGARAAEEEDLPRELLWQVLSAEDTWAGPLVVQALESGDFDPEVLRLAGALRPREALSFLLPVLAPEGAPSERPPAGREKEEAARIPLEAAPVKKEKKPLRLDPVLVVRAVASFRDQPEALDRLRSLLDELAEREELKEDEAALAAEVIRSLGRWGDQEAAETIYQMWVRNWGSSPGAHLVRRAALEALASLSGPLRWARILETVRERRHPLEENRAPVREAADFFGRVRYSGAVPLLAEIIPDPESTATLRQACLQALSRIATPEAARELESLAGRAELDLAQSAAGALEELVRERALWLGLEDYVEGKKT